MKLPSKGKETPVAGAAPKDAGAAPESAAVQSVFPMQVAIASGVLHICFFVIVVVAGFSPAILAPHSADWLLRLAELPGALLVDLIGQGQNIDSFIPYTIVFVINTFFYAVVGLGIGHLLVRFKAEEEVKALLNMEEEQQ